MAHSLTQIVAPISTTTTTTPSSPPSICHIYLPRRDVALSLVGAVFGLGIGGGRSAEAAARRPPPPPPPSEKKDPNVSGVLAKVLASKKRKEAMKESIAQLRQKGKAIINEPSPAPAATE